MITRRVCEPTHCEPTLVNFGLIWLQSGIDLRIGGDSLFTGLLPAFSANK